VGHVTCADTRLIRARALTKPGRPPEKVPTVRYHLPSLGWDDFRSGYATYDRADQRPGRVARVDRGICTTLTADGPVRASLSGGMLAAVARDSVAMPCAGDWAVVRTWADGRATVEAVLPRRTALVRASAEAAATGQVLAANIDAVAVVEPLDPSPDPGRIERLLSLAWQSGAAPLLVLTKVDLCSRPELVVRQIAAVAPGVPVLPVAATTGTGLAGLLPHVAPGRTLGLVGGSGAGKSTLVNALVGARVMETRSLRTDGRGRHTTTYRALVPVPDGGAIVDTPGIRGVGLFASVDGLSRAFVEIDDLAAHCRFADCGHDAEPGCAVHAALESGDLTRRRYDSWRKLQRELVYEERRRQIRLARGGRWSRPQPVRPRDRY